MAIVGFRHSRSTTDKAVDAARNTNKETLDATRKGQIADLYSRAIDQLGSKMLDARIGGIYALERVAQDSDKDHPTVMEVLGAFIREHSHEGWPTPATDELRADVLDHTTRPDVQAALTVIGHGDRGQDRRPIDLAARTSPARTSLARTSPARTSPKRPSPARTSPKQPSPARTSPTRTSLRRQTSETRTSPARTSQARTSQARTSETRISPALPSTTRPSKTWTSEARSSPTRN